MMFKKSLLTMTMGLALLATGAAHAQMGSSMSSEGHGMHMQEQANNHKNSGERMHKRQQHRMEKLKQSLKLGADQAASWTAFESAMQMPAMAHPDHKAMANMATPERLDAMNKMKTERDAQMQKRQDATRTFYASLNPEQKKIFDSETARAMHQHDRHGKMNSHGH
jgi:hypothetical protein